MGASEIHEAGHSLLHARGNRQSITPGKSAGPFSRLMSQTLVDKSPPDFLMVWGVILGQ